MLNKEIHIMKVLLFQGGLIYFLRHRNVILFDKEQETKHYIYLEFIIYQDHMYEIIT